MGDQLRMTPAGPRSLSDEDFREKNTPKVIRNPESGRIVAKSASPFDPIIKPERFGALQGTLDQRAAKQRGKPRAQDPSKDPRGCRVFDWNCTRTMYRVPYSNSFRYTCSLYMQSDSQQCAHNHIEGPAATTFALSCISQRLASGSLLSKLKARLLQLAEHEIQDGRKGGEAAAIRAALNQVRRDFDAATQNMLRAQNDDQYSAMAASFEELKRRKAALEADSAALEVPVASTRDVAAQVDAAVGLALRLGELVSLQKFAEAREAIELANVKLFVKFKRVQVKRRVLNQIAGGVVTLGAAQPPFTPYEGPTNRSKVTREAHQAAIATTGPAGRRSPTTQKSNGSGREGTSLGNVSRGDSCCTFVDETPGLGLVLGLLPNSYEFSGEQLAQFIEPGLYSKRGLKRKPLN
jgi:hypothetical protein